MYLKMVEERYTYMLKSAPYALFRRKLDVGVFENNRARFPSQFHQNWF